MKKLSYATFALGLMVAGSSILPATAMPTTKQPSEIQTDVQQARVVVKYGNWRGHRGYRYQRHGYRRHSDGFWYPSAAFIVVAPTVRVRVGGRHVSWCRQRYVTYRSSDNTFVARGNVRVVCRSPY